MSTDTPNTSTREEEAMYSNDAGLLQVNLSQLSAYDMDQNIPTITVTFEGGDERT